MRLVTLTCALGLALAAAGCGGVDAKTACASDADCFTGYACDLADTKQCLRRCDQPNPAVPATGCLDSETCVLRTGETVGVCKVTATP